MLAIVKEKGNRVAVKIIIALLRLSNLLEKIFALKWGVQMKGEAQSFDWFKDKLFEIPFFQRPYVWKEENWEELWNNIVFSTSDEMPFIGSFILQTEEINNLTKYMVIDGQQRLITLSILIKAFLDSSIDLKMDEVYLDAINEIEKCIKQKKVVKEDMKFIKYPRIIPSSIDKEDFLMVMETVSTKEISEKSHNILRCYKFFMEKFTECDKNHRLSIGTKFVSNTKFFIGIELDPKDDEQKIFDSVNRLGMKLLNSDIIKNNLYQRLKEIAEEDIDVNEIYKKNWTEVYQLNDLVRKFWEKEITIGRNKGNQLDEFLKDFATIKGLYVASQIGIDGLSKSFKDYTNTLSLKELLDFIEEITSYAHIYFDLFNRNIEDTCFDKYDNLGVLLLTFKVTKTSTFNPYLLKLIHDNPSNLEGVLFELEKFIIKRLIYSASTKNYNKVCERLLKSDDAIGYLESYSDDSIDYTIYPLGLSNISNDNAKLILLIIELIKRKISGESKFATLAKYSSFQLEHILPKRWLKHWREVPCYNSDGSQVVDFDLITTIREQKKLSIGNLTILKGKLNKSISNGDFQSKIKGNGKKLGIEDFVSGLLVAKEIVTIYEENHEWNEKYIYKREKDLFDVLNGFYHFVDNASIEAAPIISLIPLKDEIDINDESIWPSLSYRRLAFELIKDLVINGKIKKEEIKLLCTFTYTHTIIKKIKAALLTCSNELVENSWKKKRYSKASINYDDIQLHVSTEFTKQSLDELIVWYKHKKKGKV